MNRYILIVLMVLPVSPQLSWGGEKMCRRDDAIKAEEQKILQTWEDIYHSFQLFKQCDTGGAVSEIYSEAVSRLLAKNWETATQLNRLILNDEEFERFIFQHIDNLMLLEHADKIAENIKLNCQPDMRYLCKRINNRMRELKSTSSPFH